MGGNFKTVTVEEVSTVETCNSCGIDLSDVDPSAREERVLYDIEYTVKKLNLNSAVGAESNLLNLLMLRQ